MIFHDVLGYTHIYYCPYNQYDDTIGLVCKGYYYSDEAENLYDNGPFETADEALLALDNYVAFSLCPMPGRVY